MTGNILMLSASLFLGPAPFFTEMRPSVSLIYGMTAIVGVGYSLVMVSSFGRAYYAAMQRGFKDDMAANLIVSGKNT